MLSKFLGIEDNNVKGTLWHLGVLSGVFYLGYKFGSQYNYKSNNLKSIKFTGKVKEYTVAHSTPTHPTLKKLMDHTLEKFSEGRMIGAPEVMCMNTFILKSINGKKVLDVGVFTGSSSLIAALVVKENGGDNGKVVACDINDTYIQTARKYWKEAGVDHLIDVQINPAGVTLQSLIDQGESESFDFAFIDADKIGYDSYYEKCLILLRQGGIIAIDNTLWSHKVITNEDQAIDTVSLRNLNNKLANDKRVQVVQLNIGDGYTMALKL